MTKGADMKIGSCGFYGMSGHITNASTQFLYCLVLAMSEQFQAARRYVRCLRPVVRFDLASACLAVAFVFSSPDDALAQQSDIGCDFPVDSPTGWRGGLGLYHDGSTSFNYIFTFQGPVTGFDKSNMSVSGVRGPAGVDPLLLAGQAGTIDGTGWLVGPYFAARHDTQPLYFEGRLLYRQSDNDIRFNDPALGVRTGSFDTRRLLAQLRVEGEIAMSDAEEGPRLIPFADARWIEDRAAAFTTVSATGGSVPVPGQKVSVSRLELGSNVEVPIAVSTGSMTLTGGLGLVWSNTEGDYVTSVSRGHGRARLGFHMVWMTMCKSTLKASMTESEPRYEGYGLSLSAEMKF